MKIFLYLIISSLSLTISCNSKRNQIEFENRVLNQVFKELTDSLIYFQSFPPPPPPPGVDSSDQIFDTSNIVLYRKLVSHIDTTRKVIAITDSTKIDDHFKKWINIFQPYFDTAGFHLTINELIKSNPEERSIVLDQITNTGKYELMKLSDLNKIQTKHPFLEYYFIYYGNMTLSKIYFDDSNDKGFLTCEISGRFFHYSYLIFIEKDFSKWVIKKMRLLSIS